MKTVGRHIRVCHMCVCPCVCVHRHVCVSVCLCTQTCVSMCLCVRLCTQTHLPMRQPFIEWDCREITVSYEELFMRNSQIKSPYFGKTKWDVWKQKAHHYFRPNR